MGDCRSFRQLDSDSVKAVEICQSRGDGGNGREWARIARKLLGLHVREKACSLKVVGCLVLGRKGPIYS